MSPARTRRCFFTGRGRAPGTPAFAIFTPSCPGTCGGMFPFTCSPPPSSRSRFTPRAGGAGWAAVGVRTGAGCVGGGAGAATGVDTDCGVPIPTGVRPRGWGGC